MEYARWNDIWSLMEPILAQTSTELVESKVFRQGHQLVIRLLVDKVGGVTIADCARLNRQIGEALELANVPDEPYTLEVSSPGLDRPLASKRDFERAIGEQVEVDSVEPSTRSQKQFTGQLLAVQQDAIVVTTQGGNITIAMSDIQRAKKALRW
jgi:ribosome maturation factor RimP